MTDGMERLREYAQYKLKRHPCKPIVHNEKVPGESADVLDISWFSSEQSREFGLRTDSNWPGENSPWKLRQVCSTIRLIFIWDAICRNISWSLHSKYRLRSRMYHVVVLFSKQPYPVFSIVQEQQKTFINLSNVAISMINRSTFLSSQCSKVIFNFNYFHVFVSEIYMIVSFWKVQ